MIRERILNIILVLVGLFFLMATFPVIAGLFDPARSDTGDTMMMALYATLGVFLLIAARNPSGHRSLIAFAAWSSFAHAAVMFILGLELPNLREGFLLASAVLFVIGTALIVLAPARQTGSQAKATVGSQ